MQLKFSCWRHDSSEEEKKDWIRFNIWLCAPFVRSHIVSCGRICLIKDLCAETRESMKGNINMHWVVFHRQENAFEKESNKRGANKTLIWLLQMKKKSMATTTTTTTKLTTTTATTARLTISTTTTTTTTKTYDSVAKIFLGEKRGNICRKFYAGKSLTDAKKVKKSLFLFDVCGNNRWRWMEWDPPSFCGQWLRTKIGGREKIHPELEIEFYWKCVRNKNCFSSCSVGIVKILPEPKMAQRKNNRYLTDLTSRGDEVIQGGGIFLNPFKSLLI